MSRIIVRVGVLEVPKIHQKFLDQVAQSNPLKAEFIENMDEETWLSYQENIRQYLESEEAKLFSPNCFVDNILKAVRECLN